MPIFRAFSHGSVHAWRDVVSSARRPARLARSLLPTLALTLAWGVAACLAPTLPIPPPSAPEVSAPDSNGQATVKGDKGAAKPEAVVTVVNQTAKEGDPACQDNAVDAGPCTAIVGTPVHADGSYWTVIHAKSGDRIHVYQTVGTTNSDDSAEVVVP